MNSHPPFRLISRWTRLLRAAAFLSIALPASFAGAQGMGTPAPSFSGVTGPNVIFYAGATVAYRMPALANADAVSDITYSVTPALPAGYSVNASTGTITGSHSSASEQATYRLRATDSSSRTAELFFLLRVDTGAGIEKITITSDPGSDKTYGKTGDFGTNDTITVTVDFTHRLSTPSNQFLRVQIGSNRRTLGSPTHHSEDSSRWDKLYFNYAVQASDRDVDGISLPSSPLGGGQDNGLRFVGVGDTRVNRAFGLTPDDPNHKVRGQQTTPGFGSSPSYSWVRGNAVSQVLPAATGGEGGVTYAIEGNLPAGLSFAAATRTISGTPTATQAATSYMMVATDADGDSGTLTFSIEIEEIVVSSISSPSVAEGAAGATATLEYDVTLNRAPGRQVTVDWAAAADPGTATSGTDYTAITGGTLTFAAAQTSRTFEVTVTGDALDEPDETVRVALSNPSGAVLGSAVTGVGTITDDDATPTLLLALSEPDAGNPDTINESGTGNATTVTASLDGGTSGEAITVTVSATPVYAALADDDGYSLSAARTLTIAAGATASTGTVTVTALDDAIDSAAKTATVGGTVAGGHGLVAAPSGVTLTIADDDAQPRSTLVLTPASISESGGVTTVTATLSNPSANAVTVAVTATAVSPAVAGDFALSSAATLMIAGGQTASSGTVTVTAVGNETDAPDKSVTVSGSASGTPGAADPPDATLTIRDDDGAPTVSLVLSSSSVSESGGVVTVTAALNGTSSAAVTVTVATAEVASSGAVPDDFALSAATTLTIAANAMTSTGAVTLTARDNDVDSPHKRVTVSGTASGGNGIADPASLTLTLADDEATPTTRLALSSASIAEAGGVSTVTATLSGVSSEATTVTVSASPGAGTDFTLTGTTLTIAAGDTTSTGAVTVTAEPDTTDSADKRVAVSGAASGGNGAESPSDATLTIVDDDALPTLSLSLSASTIDESGSGNVATVTAALSHPSGEAVEVTVSLSPTLPAVAGDFSLSANTMLTIAAGDTTSAGDVTITAVDDPADAPDKETTVWGTATGGRGVTDPARGLTLTVADGDDAPGVTLSVSPTSISENRNAATVTATLTHPSSAATTVTVTGVSGFYTVGSDATIVIAAGQTANASDTALVVAVNDDVHQGSGGRSTTVTGTASNTQGVGSVTGAPLTLTDNEGLPEVTLVLSPTSISEDGEVSTVTATLSRASSEAVTVTVDAAAGTGAVADDFALSAARTLTIASGDTTSAGAVTVTANDNATDAPNKQVTVSGTASGGNGVAAPPDATLTLTDDEDLPEVALVLSSTSISESSGVSTVTATLSVASSEAVTVTVDAAAGTGAVADDFALSEARTLTIASGDTTSSGAVTVTANGNTVDSPDKSVTVSGTASGGNGVTAPSDVTLTLTDDELLPTVTLALSSSSISEGGGVTTVTAALSGESSEAVTVAVSAAPLSGAVVADYALSANKALVIAARSTASTGTVTLTAVNNDVQAANKTVTVSGAASGGNGVSAPAGLTLTIADNDGSLPIAGTRWTNSDLLGRGVMADWNVTTTSLLAKTASQPIETSGTLTPNITDVWACATRTVVQPDQFPVADPGTRGCTQLSNNSQPTTITLTQAMIDNDGVVIVFAIGIGANSAQYTNAEWVPIVALPKATLSLSPSSISENGGVATVTATLDKAALSAATLTVSVPAGDFTLSAATTLTFATEGTASTGMVTITATDNATDEPDKRVTVSASASGDVRAPPDATLTITDDEAAPTVTLALSASSISENGGESTVTATLSHPSSAATTVTVTGVSDFYTAGSDATIVIAAGETANAADVATVAAVDDDVYQGGAARSTTVTATVANDQGAESVTGAPLTLTDDETLPTVALALSEPDPTKADTIPESGAGNASTVTATLSGVSSEAVVVTVDAVGATASAGDFTLSPDRTLTIAAGSTTSTGTVTVTALDDTTDEADETVTVSATVSGGNGVTPPPDVTLTITDDEALPTVTLVLSPTSISEDGGEATVTATLSGASSAETTVTVTPVSGFYAVDSDAVIVIAAGETAAASDTATVAAVNNATDAPDRAGTVTATVSNDRATADGTTMAVTGGALTVTDDDAAPNAALSLNPASVTENGGVSTVSATLTHPSSEPTTVTVAAVPGSYTVGSDATIVIAAGETTNATDTVAITAVDNAKDEPDRTATVTATLANSQGAGTVSGALLTLEDDDAAPGVTLSVASSSIPERGGSTTVSAVLSRASSAVTTVTVTPVSGVYTVGSGAAGTIVIAAGETVNATDTAAITAVDNAVDAADNVVTVMGMAENAQATAESETMAVTGASLTITDDDTAGFSVSPSTSTSLRLRTTEDGGTAAFEVELGSEPTGDVVLDVASSDATEGAVSVSSLTFTAMTWSTAQTVTLAGVDDAPDDGDQDYTVTLRVNMTSTADAIYDALSAVTVYAVNADNEYGLVVGEVMNQATEAGGTATFTVALVMRPSAAVTVSVSSRDASGNPDTSEGTASPSSLTFAATAWNVTQTVTVTGADDAIDDGDVAWNVRLDPSSGDDNYDGLSNVDVLVTTTDDDDAPGVVLAVSPASISENGGEATVTATLSRASGAATTVTVTTVPGFYTVGSDTEIVIAAGSTAAASDTATVTAVNNTTDAPDRVGTVTATVSNDVGAGSVSGAALTVTDDDDAPNAALSLNPASVTENGGVSTVSAMLTHPSSEPTTVTVAAAAVPGAYTVGSDTTIVIAAGETTNATDTAAITAVDNAKDEPDRTATVTATLANSQGAGTVSGALLTLEDDDTAPGVTLSVASSSIPESGGSTTVSAVLSRASSAVTTVTVTPVPGVYTVGSGSDATIVIAAGETVNATDTATITAVDNAVDAADNVVTVMGTAENAQATAESETMAVTGASLTITDDDTAGFSVSPSTSTSLRLRTTEDGGTAAFEVELGSEPTGDVVLDVASSDATEGAVSVSSLTFTAMTWSTAQTVTLAGVDDAPDDGDQDYTVTLRVNMTSTADAIYDALSAVTVYAVNADNEYGLVVGEVMNQATEAGGTATFTVALVMRPSAAVTVSVSSRDASGNPDTSEGTASPSSLTFAATAWNTAQTVTVTGADDAIDDGEVTWAMRLDPSSGDANYDGLSNVDVLVTTTDDDAAPGVVLAVSPASIVEDGGTATVTAALSHPSGAATTVTVTEETGFYAVGSDAVIVIAAGETANATDTATVAAVNNATDAPDRAGTVTATVSNDRATADGTTMAVTGGALTVTDDDDAPNAALSLDPPSVTENGGVSTVSATLTHPSSEPTTVTVTAVPGSYTVGSDATIVIAAGETANATDTAAITAVDNAKDEPARTATVTATLANSQGAGTVSGALLTLEDDDAAPGVTVSVASSSIPENGGSTTVSATLTHPSSAVTTVTVTVTGGSGSYTVGSGAAGTIVIAAGETANATDTATVTAVDNEVDAADNTVTVTGTAANAQATAESETMTVTGASLTITDDDTAAVVVSPPPSTTARLRTTEDGGTAAFEVELGSEPTGNVVLDVASSDTAEGTVSVSSLTFTATSWDTAQTVTLTGVNDAPANLADGAQDYTVTLTVNQSSTADTIYALSASPVTVYAVNADNDATADVNQDGLVDEDDVLVMYYAYTAPGLLNRSRLRRLVLRPLLGRGSSSSKLEDTDSDYMTMLSNANDWKNNPSAGGDVNQDGLVDEDDVLVMYYAYTAPGLLNRSRLRRLVLRPLLGRGSSSSKLEDTDSDYMTMLSNANALRTSP